MMTYLVAVFVLMIGTLFMTSGFIRRPSKGIKDIVNTSESLSDSRPNLDEGSQAAQDIPKFDNLTGLRNQWGFEESSAELIRSVDWSREALCLFLCDINDFKYLNDFYGPLVADEVIKITLQRLCACFGTEAMIGRLASDRFGVMFKIEHSEDMDVLADSLATKLQGDIDFQESCIKGSCIKLSVSCGLAQVTTQIDDLKELLKGADMALTAAKSNNSSIFQSFNGVLAESGAFKACREVMQDTMNSRTAKILFQPIYDNKTVICYESLSRWEHRIYGQISPEIFFKQADRMIALDGLSLCEILFENSVREFLKLNTSARMTFNLTPGQVTYPSIGLALLSWMEKYNFDPRNLVIEISESTPIETIKLRASTLELWRNIGVKIALDDFGKKNSALEFLKLGLFDYIKLDKKLLHEARDHKVAFNFLKNLNLFCAALGHEVIIAGAESHEDLALLKQAGIENVQGYFIGKPASVGSYLHAA